MRNNLNIKRLTNAESANRILNDPAIKPNITGSYDGFIDLQPAIDDKENVVLGHEHGVAFFKKLQPGYYEMHISVLPIARGEWVARAAQYCFNYMFTHTDAIEIITRCPETNTRALHSALNLGMVKEFETRAMWPTIDRRLVKMTVLTKSIHQWANEDATLIEDGEWLHERYKQEFERLGVTVPAHDNDENHNRYVGAAVAMARAGEFRKAIGFYNRWAALAGYSPANVTRLEPVEIEVDNFTMRLTRNNFEIIKCPQSSG